MTKPGYTHIIVSIDVHKKLKQLAKQNNTTINKLLKQILGINTSINTKNARKKLNLVRPPGFEPGSSAWQADFYGYSVDWRSVREDFLEYAENYGYSRRTIRDFTSYLDRFVGGPVQTPFDVMRLFSGLSRGQAHHLDRALRALLNYYRDILCYPEHYIKSLKRAIPRVRVNVDINVPDETEVYDSLVKIRSVNEHYRILWLLCLESGVRLIEAVKVLNEFDMRKLHYISRGCCRYTLGLFRGMKQAYYAYFTINLLNKIKEKKNFIYISANASHYYSKHKLLSPKYLRKFAYDKMTEIGIPESTADFIQGRVPKTIGAKHYSQLLRKADRHYPKYARYILKLKKKADHHE